tara:strand:- start:1201 stop:1560 length:360 start_codon:yes stop_codon:yes gene_type:complete
MANKFKSKLQANIAFSTPGGFANIGAYSVPTGCVATVIGMSIANMNVTTQATVDIQVNKGTGPAGNIRLLQAAPVPIGGALVAVGGDQKVVLEVNQSMQVKATTGNVDVIMSILESDQT